MTPAKLETLRSMMRYLRARRKALVGLPKGAPHVARIDRQIAEVRRAIADAERRMASPLGRAFNALRSMAARLAPRPQPKGKPQ